MTEPPDNADDRADGDARAANGDIFIRRNYLLGIANGAIGRMGFAFINPSLILAAFIYEQTESNTLVGLIATLGALGVFFPQLYISRLIEHLPRKKPFYIGAMVLRIASLGCMGITMLLAGTTGSSWPLVLFFVSFVLLRAGDAAGALPFFDIVGQTITPVRLGRFFAWRGILGDSLGLAAGYMIVQPVLRGVPSPYDYPLLVGCGLVLMTVAWLTFSLSDEEESPNPPRERGLRQTLVEAARVLSVEPNYRRLFTIRMLTRVAGLTQAFYVPYGIERLGAVEVSGIYITCMAASRIASSFVWGRISDSRGNRLCLIGAGALFALSPVAALAAPHLPAAFAIKLPYTAAILDLPLTAYLVGLGFFGAAIGANMIGVNAFMIESAPPGRRPSYMAFLNTVTSPLAVLPLVAGALIDGGVLELDTLFICIATAGVLSFLTAARLEEVRRPGTTSEFPEPAAERPQPYD